MERRFEFEFSDQSSENRITFEYDDDSDESFNISFNDGVPTIYANRSALIMLAKTFIKMSLCEYSGGFHVHLRQDFDADKPEVIQIVLLDE
jgi:hypothetical protein